MRNRHLAFVDLEMTGLDPEKHEIISIGLLLARQLPREDCGPDTEVISEHEWKVRPEHIETADPESLAIARYSEAEWKDAGSLALALEEFSHIAKDAIMVSHNVSMDAMFLEKAFSLVGKENPLHYHRLDTMSLAFGRLYDDLRVEKFSLRALAEFYGIINERAHTALSDARTSYEILVEKRP